MLKTCASLDDPLASSGRSVPVAFVPPLAGGAGVTEEEPIGAKSQPGPVTPMLINATTGHLLVFLVSESKFGEIKPPLVKLGVVKFSSGNLGPVRLGADGQTWIDCD